LHFLDVIKESVTYAINLTDDVEWSCEDGTRTDMDFMCKIVDHNLHSINLKNLSQIEIIKNFSFMCVLEVKYPTNLDKYVRSNLKEITLRLSKNSKFINSAFESPSYFS